MKLLLALAVLLQAAGMAPALNPADYPQHKTIAPNVHVWSDVHPSGLYTTNNLIVVTSDGVLVADGQKDAATTNKMIEWIAATTRQPIKVLVVGSEHGDHTGGHSAFPAAVSVIKHPLADGKQTTEPISPSTSRRKRSSLRARFSRIIFSRTCARPFPWNGFRR